MATAIKEVGRKVSAANEAKLRAALQEINEILDLLSGKDDTTADDTTDTKEAAKIPPKPAPTLDDIRASLQKLIDLLPPKAKADLEGDAAILQGHLGDPIASESANVSEADAASCDMGADAFGNLAPPAQKAHLVDKHGVAADHPMLGVPAKRFAMHAKAVGPAKEAATYKADASETLKCAKCGDMNSPDAKFCDQCGAKMNGTNEAAVLELNGDYFPLVEKSVAHDGSIQIKFIKPGWGSSGYYGKEVLERDGPVAFPVGTKMYWDHPTIQEEKDRPERSLRDLAAVTTSKPVYMENGKEGPGLYANAKLRSDFAKPLEELAQHIGVSIRASGAGYKGEAEGRKGNIIEKIVGGKSIDFVTEPGAGGQIISLFEAARPTTDATIDIEPVVNDVDSQKFKENKDDMATDQEMKEVQKKSQELQSENDRLREKILLREARDFALEELAKVEGLPPPSLRRLASDLALDPPTDDDGDLDKKVFRTRIKERCKSESEYLASVFKTGTVKGVGESRDDDDDDSNEDGDSDSLSEAMRRRPSVVNSMEVDFGRLGLSDKISKQAARGR